MLLLVYSCRVTIFSAINSLHGELFRGRHTAGIGRSAVKTCTIGEITCPSIRPFCWNHTHKITIAQIVHLNVTNNPISYYTQSVGCSRRHAMPLATATKRRKSPETTFRDRFTLNTALNINPSFIYQIDPVIGQIIVGLHTHNGLSWKTIIPEQA